MPLPTARAVLATATTLSLLAVLTASVPAAAPTRGFGPAGSGSGELGPHVSAVAVAADGTVYVADPKEGEIEVFAHGGTPLARHEVPGARALATDGNRLLVADGAGVLELDGNRLVSALGVQALALSDGRILTARASGVYTGDDLLAPLPEVNGIAVAPDGDIFVSSSTRVHRLGGDGELVDDWPAPDVRGIAVTPDGDVLLAQGTRHEVGVYSISGEKLDVLEGMNVVGAVAADCRGNVYALDHSDPRGHIFPVEGAEPPPCVTPTPTPTPEPIREPSPTPQPTPAPEGAVLGATREDEPILGQTQRAVVLRGEVYAGKGRARRRVTGRTLLPVSTSFDTADGAVRLEYETTTGADRTRYGRYMSGEFSGGEFTTHQGDGDSLVEIHLEGSGVGAGTGLAQAAAKAKPKSVWSTAKGKFRTNGRHGAATVRGTRWYTEDRSDGTYFRVSEGSISVKDFRTGRTRVLTAPESYLARAGCVSRRLFWIRLSVPVGTRVDAVAVSVGARRARLRRDSRVRALVDLRGMSKGPVTVRIRVRLADGRSLTGTRRYTTCSAAERAGGAPPPL